MRMRMCTVVNDPAAVGSPARREADVVDSVRNWIDPVQKLVLMWQTTVTNTDHTVRPGYPKIPTLYNDEHYIVRHVAVKFMYDNSMASVFPVKYFGT